MDQNELSLLSDLVAFANHVVQMVPATSGIAATVARMRTTVNSMRADNPPTPMAEPAPVPPPAAPIETHEAESPAPAA